MSDVTLILERIESGDEQAAERLLPLVYNELRKLAAARLANEKPGQTLQATALVHEAYLRLVGTDAQGRFNSRGHFFAAAAQAMRRILVEQARRKLCLKRAPHLERISLDDELALPKSDPDAARLLAIHEALDILEAEQPRKAELVKLRYFAGMTLEEAAAALGISLASANRDWAYARAWLFGRLEVEEK